MGVLLWAVLLGVVGCSAAAPASIVADQAASSGPMPAPASGGVTREYEAAASVSDDTNRMIIRNANMRIVVTDASQAVHEIDALVAGLGGYVADSSAWRDGEQLRARMTVRLPATSLDDALATIRSMAVSVQSENLGGQDVTEEFSDLSAQLVNLEATENELRELLSEVRQRTQRAEDILDVYRELANIRGEIERVKGRMQYLSTLTEMATLTIELIPDVLSRPVVEPGWRPQEELRNASRALVKGFQWIVKAAIWLILTVIPLLLVIAVPIVLLWLLVRWLVRRGRASRRGKVESQ
jgi:hypothetical protein